MVNSFVKYFVSILSIFTVISLFWLTFSIDKVSQNLKYSVEKHIESSITQYANKFSLQIKETIKKKDQSLIQILKNDSNFRNECNKRLELIRNDFIPYIYLLWLDKDGKFRFLCDGSLEKSHFFQKFDPGNLKLWQEIYNKGIPKTIDQQKYEGLWKSLLYPIKENNFSQAMLVVDYSVHLPTKVKQIIQPFQTLLNIVLISIFILLIIAFSQILHIFFVKKKTYIDPLTNIYNRRFLQYISKKIPLYRYDILMIDLDHFKKINDIYGHLIGDKVLKHTTKLIKSNITKKDYFIRFGGEEFIILLNNKKSSIDSFELAEKIRQKIQNNPLEDKDYGYIEIKVSIGLNRAENRDINFEAAIKNADKALYGAKKAGRNCVVEIDLKTKIEKNPNLYTFTHIKSLIDNMSVVCHFQPIFLNKTDKIVKYEVLTRLQNEDGRLLMPNDFLPVIWHTNVYQRLTRQVIQNSIDTFRNREENFSINLGLQDILDEKIILIIEEFAKKEPTTIARMGIEILEYDRFDNIERLKEIMKKLKKFGISIILDDFGSGHANFAIIEQLNIDELKIDGNIVENINTNKKSKTLLKSLALFAQESQIKTTVEYVSSKEIFDSISKMPFDYLQGFYLGVPKEI